jgi:signal transduction histidine kinase
MGWCVMRQDLVDLTSGVYQTSLNIVDVKKLLKRTAASAGKVLVVCSNKIDEAVRIVFDERMATLALENAMSNAVAHGDGTRIDIEADVKHGAFEWLACSFM